MNLSLKSIEKLIKGQKRTKKGQKAIKGNKRPLKAKTLKTIDFITIQCKIINK